VGFRVWTQFQFVFGAIFLHSIQVALEDISVNHEGGGWMVFGDFVEKHGIEFEQKEVGRGSVKLAIVKIM
jgi:hypothetical protein